MSWVVRRFKGAADREEILKLRALIFQGASSGIMSEERWMWQFIHNPAGEAISYLAVVQNAGEEQIVGQYVVIPAKFYVRGELRQCSMSLDTMTHPHYHRQGIFVTLANEVYREISDNGNSLTFGFANDNSFHGFVNKLSWYHVCDVPMYIKVLRCNSLLKSKNRCLRAALNVFLKIIFRTRRARPVQGLKVFEVKKPVELVNTLIESNLDLYPYIRNRDNAYLKWRFFEKPGCSYKIFAAEQNGEIKGYIVLDHFLYRDTVIGAVVDLFVSGEESKYTVVLLERAAEYFQSQNIDILTLLISANKHFIKQVKAFGFRKIPDRFNPKKWHFIVRDNLQAFEEKDLTSPNHYYLTWADTDVI